MSKSVYKRLYASADTAADLPWHNDEPPEMLEQVVAGRGSKGRALDLGCGAGVYSVWLASQGYEVTSLDFTVRALEMTKERAAAAGVELKLVEADVTSWTGEGPYDVILDSGCLHSFGDPGMRKSYRDGLLRWLAPDGDYVLGHFIRRHRLDWRPIGPRRYPPERISSLFSPALKVAEHTSSDRRTPLPIGPWVRLGMFHFRR